MTGAEIIATAKTAAKIVKGAEKVKRKIDKWIKQDQARRIIVKEDFIAGRFAGDIRGFPSGAVRMGVPDFQCPDFGIVDGVMTIYATGDRTPFCDGATYFPDKVLDFDLMAAALVHDALYQHMEAIATIWGWSKEDVRWLADAALGNALNAEAEHQKSAVMRVAGGVISRLAYTAVRAFGGIYHRSRKGAVALVALLLLCGGACIEIPDVFVPSDVKPNVDIILNEDLLAAGVVGGTVPDGEAEPGRGGFAWPEESAHFGGDFADAVDFATLDWRYGGFDGKAAAPVKGCEIVSLEVTSGGLSYKWASGGCELLGAEDKGDYNHTVAALFVRGADGKWRGGKFDWISTSRTTRDFKNIREGYGGWPRDAIETAREFAFVIVSKDGRKRSNVITAER